MLAQPLLRGCRAKRRRGGATLGGSARHEPLVRARLGRGNRRDRRGQPRRVRHFGRISVEDVSRVGSRGQASGATLGWTSRGRVREKELTVVSRAGATGSRGATPEGTLSLRRRFGGAGGVLGAASAEREGPLPRLRVVRDTRQRWWVSAKVSEGQPDGAFTKDGRFSFGWTGSRPARCGDGFVVMPEGFGPRALRD